MRDQANKLEKILNYLRQQNEGEFDQDEYIDVRTEVLTTFDNPPIAPRTINDIAIERKREIRDQINSLDEELQFLTEYESLLESDLNDIRNQQFDVEVNLDGPTQKAQEVVDNLEDDDDNNGAFINANIGGLNIGIGGGEIEVNAGQEEEPVGEVQIDAGDDEDDGGAFLQAKIGGVELNADLDGDIDINAGGKVKKL